jgi:hypothetical protein
MGQAKERRHNKTTSAAWYQQFAQRVDERYRILMPVSWGIMSTLFCITKLINYKQKFNSIAGIGQDSEELRRIPMSF